VYVQFSSTCSAGRSADVLHVQPPLKRKSCADNCTALALTPVQVVAAERSTDLQGVVTITFANGFRTTHKPAAHPHLMSLFTMPFAWQNATAEISCWKIRLASSSLMYPPFCNVYSAHWVSNCTSERPKQLSWGACSVYAALKVAHPQLHGRDCSCTAVHSHRILRPTLP
jgi:hypothetical protein